MNTPILHTPIKHSKDSKGITIYTTITLKNGKKRLRKRVKEIDLDDTIKHWEYLLLNGVDPTDEVAEDRFINKDVKVITLNDAFNFYLEKSNLADNTIKSFENKLIVLQQVHGKVDLKNITAIDIEDAIKSKIDKNEWSNSTVKNAKNVYSTFFNWCVKAKLLDENPTKNMLSKLKSKKDVKDRYTPISDNDMPLIMEKIRDLKGDKQYDLYLFVNMIYHACIRPTEICNLLIGDFDFVKNEITVRASVSKNGNKGVVPIFPALLEVLKEFGVNKKSKDSKLFNFKSYGRFYRIFSVILKDLKLDKKGYSPYCFKHTSNVHKVVKNKWQPHQIQKLNRHSSLVMTMNYLKKLNIYTDFSDLESTAI